MRKPNKKEINLALNSFSKKERIVFFAFVIIFIVSLISILKKENDKYLVEIPTLGGNVTEGVIGETPRFINPLLATSDADRDLTQLIYSGLLRVDENGKYIPDLAESYDISSDGLVYTFRIRKAAVWQDGKPVTADDIEFTILKAKDPAIKSFKRPGFEGVSVEKSDDKTIVFKLKQRYAPFLENLTIGILPKHIWGNISYESFASSNYNIKPIGSGPYKIDYIATKKASDSAYGISLEPEYYDLTPFAYFTLGVAKIETVRIRFYSNEDNLLMAYRSGEIDAINTIPPQIAKTMESQGIKIIESTLPRVFGVFFNQNHSKVIADKYVRMALNQVIDRQDIVDKVLLGFGTEIGGPILNTSPLSIVASSTDSAAGRVASAQKILTSGGWKYNKKKGIWEKTVKKSTLALAVNISTANTPELRGTAEIIKKNWEDLGIKVNLNVYEIGDLNQNIIRPRKYDALFFGEIIGRNPDLFSFWHSSQRNDPGINISMYTNSKADKLLEAARIELDQDRKDKEYGDFQKELDNDIPAIFIYSPRFLYVQPSKIKNSAVGSITIPSDRFLNIYKWYIDTDKVWKIFTN
ncbi:MAG: hypothetical protein HY225_00970 [Candidatus Vogelbacteria bacterium]|nr:hypothetical protein [Candidatus Vogelbacteria bacterium]